MKTYAVLLRGVMPTGKNKVPMARLREVLSQAKFSDVRTYIQSGNVLLRSDRSAKEVETRVHDLIVKHIGPDLVIVAKTANQLQNVLDSNPFKQKDASRVFYTLFVQKPPTQKVRELATQNFSPDEVVVINDAAYMYIPGSAARSKISNNFLEKKLGVSATSRNFNTMRKLIEMSKEK